jgi:hypothetical protein
LTVAAFAIVGSYPTVQVISPTLVLDIQYTTIQTSPSGVIASLPLAKADFDAGTAGPLLTDYANNIELLMRQPHVIAGRGEQALDANGYLEDNVVFTVQYVPASSSASSVTADAVVPTGLLTEGGDPAFERILIQEAEAIIAAAYSSLVSLAGG